MAFTATWRFRHLNIVGCLLKRRPTNGGGGHGHPRTPPSYAPAVSLKKQSLFLIFSSITTSSIRRYVYAYVR